MKILASDFDGTLAFNNEISKEDINKIKEFQDAGNLFGMSTGRNYDGIVMFTEPLGIRLDFLVCASGSKIFDQHGDCFYSHCLTKDIIKRIYNATKCPRPYMFFASTGSFVMDMPGNERHTSVEDIHDIADTEYDFMAIKFNTGEEMLAQEAVDLINQKFSDEVVAYRNTINVDIVMKGNSKGNGIQQIADHFGIDVRKMNVIGDSLNDISMFDVTDHAYSFPHIEEEIKPHVNYFVDNVASCIDHILKEL